MDLLKLVIVDDEPIILEGLSQTFDWESVGFSVVGTAMSGKDALSIIEKEKVDVVLTDICMKNMDGIELMEKAALVRPETRFVVLSAYKDFEYAKAACDRGALAYIVKPVNDDMLLTMEKVYKTVAMDKKKDVAVEAWESIFEENQSSYLTYMISRLVEDSLTKEQFIAGCKGFLSDSAKKHYYAGIIADVDVIYKISEYEDFDRKRFALFSYLENGLSKEYKLLTKKNMDGSCIFLVDLGENNKLYKCKLILNNAKIDLGFDIISAITDGYYGIEGIITSLTSARKLYDFAREVDADMEDCEMEEDNLSKYPYDVEAGIIQALRKNDEEEFKAKLIVFLDSLVEETIDCAFVHHLVVNTEMFLRESYGMDKDLYKRFRGMYEALFSHPTHKLVRMYYDLGIYAISKRNQMAIGDEKHRTNEYVSRACKFIEAHLEDELTIGIVAAEVHLNPVYFGRIFKAVTNCSFKQYVLNEKLDVAKRLLVTTDLSISEIGRRVGIVNSSYFTKIFREATGKIPSDYRIDSKF